MTSILAPGAEEELYEGRDIHVDTRIRGLYGLAQGDAEAAVAELEAQAERTEEQVRALEEEAAARAATGEGGATTGEGDATTEPPVSITQWTWQAVFKMTVVFGATYYLSRGLFFREWGLRPDWSQGPAVRPDVIVPAGLGMLAVTVASGIGHSE